MKSIPIQLFIIFFCVPILANTLASGVQITNLEGQPISGAHVLIGEDLGVPFQGNELVTDINGFIPQHAEWKSHLPVTVSADNYVMATYLTVTPGQRTLVLQAEDGVDRMEVKGQATGFGRLRRDGKVDFSLVYPALKRSQLLQFDVSTVLSPEFDEMNLVGKKLHIPSNTSIPRQRENYILPITLDKPVYRMYMRQPGQYRFVASHTRFPLKKVVDEIRAGKSFFDVLNHFTFEGAGQLDLNLSQSVDGKDIAVNQIKFNESVSVLAPQYDNVNLAMISLSLVDQGGLLFPSDIKKLEPSETKTLKVPQGATHKILSVLSPPVVMDSTRRHLNTVSNYPADGSESMLVEAGIEIDFEILDREKLHNTAGLSGLSFVLHDSNLGVAPSFLDMIDPPVFANGELRVNPPEDVSGVLPLGTVAILSEVEKVPTGNGFDTEIKTRVWEVHGSTWMATLPLPNTLKLDPAKTYKWEIMYLGTSQPNLIKSHNILGAVTHLTRNTVEF